MTFAKDLSCEIAREWILARLSNQPAVDEAGRAPSEIEAHIKSCKACGELARNTSALDVRLLEASSSEILDEDQLWTGISQTLDSEATVDVEVPLPRAEGSWRKTQVGALVAIAATVLLAVFTFSPLLKAPVQQMPVVVTESINDFLTFKASGRMLDVKSTHPPEIRRWFAKRLDFELPLTSAMPGGFKLSGARLCSFLNRRLAAFMYQMGEKAVSLYVMAETGLSPISKQNPKDGKFEVFSNRGLTNVAWHHGGLLFVVVGDLPESQAIKFARSVGKATPRKTALLNLGLKGDQMQNKSSRF